MIVLPPHMVESDSADHPASCLLAILRMCWSSVRLAALVTDRLAAALAFALVALAFALAAFVLAGISQNMQEHTLKKQPGRLERKMATATTTSTATTLDENT